MSNSSYWKKQFEKLEDAQSKKADNFRQYSDLQFKKAQKQIESKITSWYVRLADNNDVSLAEARKLLTKDELEEFHWTLEEYIKNGKAGEMVKELENASAKVHISRLEAMKVQLKAECEILYGELDTGLKSTLANIYTDNYYHSAYEIQKGVKVGWKVNALNSAQVEKAITRSWTYDNDTFSDRVWKNKDKLFHELDNSLTQALIQGKSSNALISDFAKKMGVSKKNAGRLIMTEGAFVQSASRRDCFKDLDVEEFEVVATLDSHTSDICQGMDGKHFKMSEYKVGETAPPFHCWCRSCTCPYFNDEFSKGGVRAARGVDGKTYYIPDDIKYPEWKEAFVDGTTKDKYEAYTQDGMVYFKKKEEPKPPKKEYLTKKKLQENIDDLDNQQKVLQDKYAGDLLSKGTPAEQAAWMQLEDKKQDFQEMLDKKLLAEQKKSLKKQELLLQDEFDGLPINNYAGIWKDDITTADWKIKQHSIQSKKEYFENKLLICTGDEKDKFEKLLADLNKFDEEGKHYFDVQSKLKKVQADLTAIKNGGNIKSEDLTAFTQERKDAAYWFKSKKAADDVLRAKCAEVWKDAAQEQRKAAYKYTSGSGSFNRPLRGYEGSWYNFKGVGNVDLDYEGSGKAIEELTKIIDKSSYDFDIWLQRGVDGSGTASFLGIPEDILYSASQKELEERLIGKRVKEEAFFSCGSAKGTGFGGYIFNVYCPKGTKMLYSEPFSCFGSGDKLSWDGISGQSSYGSEFETIIQRGTGYEITKVEKTGGNIYFDIDVVEQ